MTNLLHPTFSTKRLKLQPLKKTDAVHLLPIFSDEATMRFTDTEPIQSLQEAEQVIKFMNSIAENGKGFRWGIYLKETFTLIGTCGFHQWDKKSNKAEIGYELGSPFWKKGYLSEALPVLIDFGFEIMNLNRIEALVFPENENSSRLLKKFNFQFEGTLRQNYFCKGKYRDEQCYALLRDD